MGLGWGRGEKNEEQAASPERVLGAGRWGRGGEKSTWYQGLAKAPCALPTNPSEALMQLRSLGHRQRAVTCSRSHS